MKNNRLVLETLINQGYSSIELCFTVKLKRKGIMKWLENKKIIKEKTEGFAIMCKSIDNYDYISSGDNLCTLKNIKLVGLR